LETLLLKRKDFNANLGVISLGVTFHNYTLGHCFSAIHILFKVTIMVECVSVVMITTSALMHFLSLTLVAFFSTHFWTLLVLSWKKGMKLFWIPVHP